MNPRFLCLVLTARFRERKRQVNRCAPTGMSHGCLGLASTHAADMPKGVLSIYTAPPDGLRR